MLLAAAALLGVHLAPTYTVKPIFVGNGLVTKVALGSTTSLK
jgi:hypothetical protein